MEGYKIQQQHLLPNLWSASTSSCGSAAQGRQHVRNDTLCSQNLWQTTSWKSKENPQADGLSSIKSKNHKGLKTLLVSDGARCIVLATIGKAHLVLNKRLPTRGWTKIHTGNIDGFWKGAKKAIPDSLPSKKRTNGTSVCGRASDATNGAGNAPEKHNETYSRDLEKLVNSPEVTRRVFGAKVLWRCTRGN